MIVSFNVFRYFVSMLCFKGGLYIVGGLRDNKRLRELLVEMFYVEENEWKNMWEKVEESYCIRFVL